MAIRVTGWDNLIFGYKRSFSLLWAMIILGIVVPEPTAFCGATPVFAKFSFKIAPSQISDYKKYIFCLKTYFTLSNAF